MSSIGLWKVEPIHNKEQNAITINWRSNWQAQKCEIFQQIGPYIGIQ